MAENHVRPGPAVPVPTIAWLKISNPDEPPPTAAHGTDLRVLLPADERFTPLADKLAGQGTQVRRVSYLLEDEAVTGPTDGPEGNQFTAVGRTCTLVRPYMRVPQRSPAPMRSQPATRLTRCGEITH